jgi:23S rRNA pseudouridine2605 synthase
MVDHSYDPIAETALGQAEEGGERIAKLLARAGVGSRRDVERMIAEGRVALNGRVLTEPGVKPAADDIITVDGAVVSEPEPTRLWRYHKPTGLITSHKDPQGRPTVFDALRDELPRVISIGRLDLNSEGLLLLTNDGELARALERPATGWIRRYRARAHGRTTQETLDKLKHGVTVDGIHYGPIEARLDKAKEGAQGANLWISLSLAEGKNREVRKVLESIGLKVNRLIRLSYGPFQLGTLAEGAVEEIGPRVIREQLAGIVPPENMPSGDRKVRPGLQAPARRPSGPLFEPPPEKTKKVYKAGWAKPKMKAGPPRAAPKKKPGPAVLSKPKPRKRTPR